MKTCVTCGQKIANINGFNQCLPCEEPAVAPKGSALERTREARQRKQQMTRFSEMEMNEAFKRVQNPTDWRGPINAVVRVDSQVELDEIVKAIMFYTATKATAFRLSGQGFGQAYRITAAGYRAGPAGP